MKLLCSVICLLALAPAASAQEWWTAEQGERMRFHQEFGVSFKFEGTEGSEHLKLTWVVDGRVQVQAVDDGDVTRAVIHYTKFALEADNGGGSKVEDQRLKDERVEFSRQDDGTFSWRLLDSQEEQDDSAEFLRYFLAEQCHTIERMNDLDSQFDPPGDIEVGGNWELGLAAAKHLRLNEPNVDLKRSEGNATLRSASETECQIELKAEIQTKTIPTDDLIELAYLADGLEELATLATACTWASDGMAKAKVEIELRQNGWDEEAKLELKGVLERDGARVSYKQKVKWEDSFTSE